MNHIKNMPQFNIASSKGTAVALGKFDGFHLGHILLLDQVKRLQEEGYTGALFTFDMKENSIFDVNAMESILTPKEKRAFVESMGLDYFVEYPFDDAFASMEPEVFVEEVLVKMLNAKYVIVGEDYRFGNKRAGDVEFLKKQEAFTTMAIPKKEIDGTIVSSSHVRGLIGEGNMEQAKAFLGRAYAVSGVVSHGKELGRTIGIPTANLLPVDGKLYPPKGVYASRVRLPDGTRCKAVTNIGENPTVNRKHNTTIETHILDFSGDIYGEEITVELLSHLRGEKKFPSLDALKAQMEDDIARAKAFN